MGTEGIIILLLLGLGLLVGVAFVLHTMERNKRERMHKEAILRKKVNDLHYMLTNFPDGFLSADLKVLICKSCLDIYQQLAQIAPGRAEYANAINDINAQTADIQKNSSGAIFKPLENLAQIKEIRVLLGLLLNYINRLKAQKTIHQNQAHAFSKQLQQLMLQTNIDTYLISAKEAEEAEKHRLAIHNYTAAMDKIKSNNLSKLYGAHVALIEERLAHLKTLAPDEVPTINAEEAGEQEWDKFMGEEDWHKKSEYD